MSSPRPSLQIPPSDRHTFHPDPLPPHLLPHELNPHASPPDPDITNPDGAHGSQSPSPTPPPPTPAPAPARPPQFAPLFALVASSSSSSASPSSGSSPTNHHPTVHYIFADDHDSDLLITAAALQTLDPDPPRPRRGGDEQREKSSAGGDAGGGGTPAAPAVAPRERFLIVDLDSTATRVVAARSMARDWQIVHADLTPAPTWDGEDSTGNNKPGDAGGRGGRGLMLRVEGVGSRDVAEDDVRDGEPEEGLEKLAERYERRLGELRRVVEGVGKGEEEGKGGGKEKGRGHNKGGRAEGGNPSNEEV